MAAAGWPANSKTQPVPNTGSYVAPAPQVQASTTPAAAAPVSAMPATPKSVVVFEEMVIDGKLKSFVELTSSFAGAPVVEIVRHSVIAQAALINGNSRLV